MQLLCLLLVCTEIDFQTAYEMRNNVVHGLYNSPVGFSPHAIAFALLGNTILSVLGQSSTRSSVDPQYADAWVIPMITLLARPLLAARPQ